MSARLQNGDISDDWKEKYYKSLNELELKEKGWLDEENRLYKSILRLVLTYSGADPELDDEFANMRKVLKNGATGEQRKEILSSIIEETLKFAEKKKKSEAQSKTSSSHDLINEFLKRLTLPGKTGNEIAIIRNRAEKIKQKKEQLSLIDDLVKLLQQVYSKDISNTDSEDSLNFYNLRDPLFQLIEWLPIPDTYTKKIDDIKNKLSTLEDEKDLNKIFRNIAGVINELQGSLESELAEIEKFLKNISGRLQDLDGHINNIVETENKSNKIFKSLNGIFKDNINKIRRGMTNSNDIDVLKDELHRTLLTIEQNMELIIEEENNRKNHTDLEVNRLQTHIEQLKGETHVLQKRIKEERNNAKIDALTGIPNRLALDERIQQEIKRCKRHKDSLTVCVLDIDKFKRVNDDYGHKAGDKVLKTVAELCSSKIRAVDFIARYGGEEFVLLLPQTPIEKALSLAEKLRVEVEKCSFHYSEKPVDITISCGLAEFRKSDSVESVFNRADKALYLAKNSGRNQSKTETDL